MKRTFTTFDIASLCDVYPTTVANWIDKGELKAFSTPGRHRRVKSQDLFKFLRKHKMPLPSRIKLSKQNYQYKILVVDDDPKVLKLITTILKKSRKGDKIYTAADGFSAGEAVSEIKPDLIILDIMLPGINGFQVCERIRDRNKHVKIIGITGYHAKENKRKILSAGANAFLPKPINMARLLKYINTMLKKPMVKNL